MPGSVAFHLRAGGRDEAARWASAHHHRSRWPASGVPITVAEALEAADNA